MNITDKRITKILREELTKQEVKAMIDDRMSSYIDDKDFKKKVRAIAVDVIDDFFHEMWRKNGFWKNPIKNK